MILPRTSTHINLALVLSNSTRKLLRFETIQNADCSLRKKYCVIYYNFRHHTESRLVRIVPLDVEEGGWNVLRKIDPDAAAATCTARPLSAQARRMADRQRGTISTQISFQRTGSETDPATTPTAPTAHTGLLIPPRDVGLVAVGVQEQEAEDVLVPPPLLRNCLTLNYTSFR